VATPTSSSKSSTHHYNNNNNNNNNSNNNYNNNNSGGGGGGGSAKPIYVNPKQYERIMKRRAQRERLEKKYPGTSTAAALFWGGWRWLLLQLLTVLFSIA